MEFPEYRDHPDGPLITTEISRIGHGPLRPESNEVMMPLPFITSLLACPQKHVRRQKALFCTYNFYSYEPNSFTFLL